MSPGWGWTPPGGAGTPPVSLNPSDGLQDIVNAIAAAGVGGVITLGVGTYYAVPSSPSTVLTIPAAAYNLSIVGQSAQGSLVGSPILCQAGKLRLADMHIDPSPGAAYGVKIYNGGTPFLARHTFDRIIIGDRAQVKADGPTNGLVLDGAGVFQASNCTFAFCAGNGLLADSTGTEPNTTLQFDMCSFVGNGGYGADLAASLGIAEFRGGNMEGNFTGELRATSVTNLVCTAVDFETSVAMTNPVDLSLCNPAAFRSCNFHSTGSAATRALIASGCQGVIIEDCRFSGWGAVGIVRIVEDCTNSRVFGNVIDATLGAGWIEDYSR